MFPTRRVSFLGIILEHRSRVLFLSFALKYKSLAIIPSTIELCCHFEERWTVVGAYGCLHRCHRAVRACGVYDSRWWKRGMMDGLCRAREAVSIRWGRDLPKLAGTMIVQQTNIKI